MGKHKVVLRIMIDQILGFFLLANFFNLSIFFAFSDFYILSNHSNHTENICHEFKFF